MEKRPHCWVCEFPMGRSEDERQICQVCEAEEILAAAAKKAGK